MSGFDRMGLVGKKALVTGGSRGIGRAAVLFLAEHGADVAVNFVRNEQAAAWTVDTARSHGVESFSVRADVSDQQAVASAVGQVSERFGHIDILVHSAGIAQRLPLTPETWDEILKVQLYSTFYVCNEVAPIMQAKKSGRIIILSSIMAHECGVDGYAVAMAGKICYAKGLAKQLAPHNINVNVVSPGTIFTEMLDPFIPPHKRREVTERAIPLFRSREGIPVAEDVGKVILFLASDMAAHITGEDIQVNGGQCIHP